MVPEFVGSTPTRTAELLDSAVVQLVRILDCQSKGRGFKSRRYCNKTFFTMGKIEKKKKKLQEQIDYLQNELVESLTKKTSTTKEIDVAGQQRKIQELKKQLQGL